MRLSLKVIPNAKQNKIVEESGRMKVYLTAPPVEGKANKALVEFLAEHYKVKKRDVAIVKGETSREKIVNIAGLMLLLVSVLALSACAPRKEPVQLAAAAFNKFPVLEYHLIGRPEGRWQRTPENFRADLEWLHSNGYYPLNLKDVLSGI